MNICPPPVPYSNHIDFPDYEAIAANLPSPPIIANDIQTSTKEGAEKLKNLLFTRYHGDVMSATPKCNCGNLSGGYVKGVRCEICDTVCDAVLNKPLESTVWMETPPGILKFISPGWWLVASKALTRSGFNLLEYIVNPSIPEPPSKNALYNVVQMLNLNRRDRNLNFFFGNFEEIMRSIVTFMVCRKKPKNVAMTQEDLKNAFDTMQNDPLSGPDILINTPLGKKYRSETELAVFVLKYVKEKRRVFTKLLPMPSAQGMILESGTAGTYAETHLIPAIDAMYAVTQIDMSLTENKMSFKNRRCIVATKKMAEFSKNYIKLSAGGKEGEFRRHVNGGRIPYSMRCVITSINDPHSHDELHLPWSPSVQFFRTDLMNKLKRRGMNPRKIISFIDRYTNVYNPVIDEIFKELISEAEDGKISVTFQRSPSLEKGSIELMGVPKIKTDPQDLTISMSENATNLFNADLTEPSGHSCRNAGLSAIPGWHTSL